jgi:hypothetical protein
MNNAQVEIYHCEWKGLREVKFAIYETDEGDEYEELYDPEEEKKRKKREEARFKKGAEEKSKPSERVGQESLEANNDVDDTEDPTYMDPKKLASDVYNPDISLKSGVYNPDDSLESDQTTMDDQGNPVPSPDDLNKIAKTEISKTPEDETKEHTKEERKRPKRIEKRWINQVYKCSRIGNYDNYIILDYGPVEQNYDITNPSKCALSYGGIITPYPLMSKVKSLQKLYNVILYRLHLQFAKSKGRIGVLDIALMPKTEGFDLSKWMYFMDALGIAFINSAENRESGGVNNNFQTQLDLSFAQDLQVYFGMLDKIEQAVSRLSGIAPQREGQTYASETLGGNNQAMMQSAAITEYMVYMHNQVKKHALQMLIDKARVMFRNGMQTQYILNDGERVLLQVDDDFPNGEYGIFVVNSPAELEIHQIVKQYAMQLVQAGNASLEGIIKVLRSNSLQESVKTLEDMREEQQQLAQQQQQQQMEAQQQMEQFKQQALREIEQMKADLKKMELDYRDRWNLRDNETRVQVATISIAGYKNPEDSNTLRQQYDQNQDNHPDFLEQQKMMHDMQLAERDQTLKEQQAMHDMQMDERALQQEQLQQQLQQEQLQQIQQPQQPYTE